MFFDFICDHVIILRLRKCRESLTLQWHQIGLSQSLPKRVLLGYPLVITEINSFKREQISDINSMHCRRRMKSLFSFWLSRIKRKRKSSRNWMYGYLMSRLHNNGIVDIWSLKYEYLLFMHFRPSSFNK